MLAGGVYFLGLDMGELFYQILPAFSVTVVVVVLALLLFTFVLKCT